MCKNSEKPYSLSPRLAKIIRSFQEKMKNLLPPLYDYNGWNDRNTNSDSDLDFNSPPNHSSDMNQEQSSEILKDHEGFKAHTPDFLDEKDFSYLSENSSVNLLKNNINNHFENNLSDEKQTAKEKQVADDMKKSDRANKDLKMEKSGSRDENLKDLESNRSKIFSNLTSSANSPNSVTNSSTSKRNFNTKNSTLSDDFEKVMEKFGVSKDFINHKLNNIINQDLKSNKIINNKLKSIKIQDKEETSNPNGILHNQPKKQEMEWKMESPLMRAKELAEITLKNSRNRSTTVSNFSHFPPFSDKNTRINPVKAIAEKEDLIAGKKMFENCLKGIAEIKQKLDRLEQIQKRDREEKKEIKFLID